MNFQDFVFMVNNGIDYGVMAAGRKTPLSAGNTVTLQRIRGARVMRASAVSRLHPSASANATYVASYADKSSRPSHTRPARV
jgi:hypothetical protein